VPAPPCHDGGVARRHLLHRAADAQHLRIARDDAAQQVARRHFAQARVLQLQLIQAQRTLHRERQHLGLERLGEEVVGAELDGPQGIGAVVLAGEHDHLHFGVDLQQVLDP
jgi:hypothetical protein